MNKQIFNELLSRYEKELSENILLDGTFHVDVEYDIENIHYDLTSTLYSECSVEYSEDYPPDLSSVNIVEQYSSLWSVDDEGTYRYYDDECEEIVKTAIGGFLV